jgi:UDP-glucuronate 4-epimerase
MHAPKTPTSEHGSRRFIVTGCAGFIGSHLVDTLLANGHDVVGIDSFSGYYPRRLKEANVTSARRRSSFRLLEAKVDTALLASLLAEADGVFHLAAQPGVRGSWGSAFATYVEHNIIATQSVLEAAADAGVRIVLASSSSVYGEATERPTPETAACRPVSPYGITKLTCEHLAAAYSAAQSADVIVLRYFTVYGPRQRPDMAFTRLMRALLTGERFGIHGTGVQTRDVTYVEDAVDATMLAFERGARGDIYNVGGGRIVSLRDVIEICEGLVGRGLSIEYRESSPGDVSRTAADTSRLTSLGWRPRVAFEDGLATQLAWVIDATRKLNDREWQIPLADQSAVAAS